MGSLFGERKQCRTVKSRTHPIFNRTQLLVGDEAMEKLASSRVIVFGVGGVGSWCAESLVRSGVGSLTLVDSDRVCVTNVNRQLMATSSTVGQVKVDALRARLLDINPRADILAVQDIYSPETAEGFRIENYDYVVDAIDSLSNKAALILHATSLPVRFVSSMGAALKMDPTQIRVGEFWSVQGCPLARALRQRFKRLHQFPKRKFRCIYSPELLSNLGQASTCGTDACVCPKGEHGPGRQDLLNHEWCTSKAQINGTMAHITAIFGFMMAGLIVQDLCSVAHSRTEDPKM
ncbi:MAG: tRNA threonylcarbamoyladenosine dehydratase [Bacteroidales bacterium]|nr:tRNA threonylcarbamoyladenosine dehydratase [Bacteroidales bacterium]